MNEGFVDKRVTTIDGVAVEYAVAGDGAPAIVLLNGAGGPMEGWLRVLAPLEAVSTVVAYNRLGIGRSGKPSEPQTGDVVVGMLHALLEKLGLCPPHVLVGHSLGGLFVNLFARTYPDEVAAAVFLESAAPEDSTLVDDHGTGFQRSVQQVVDAVFGRNQRARAPSRPCRSSSSAEASPREAFPPQSVTRAPGIRPDWSPFRRWVSI